MPAFPRTTAACALVAMTLAAAPASAQSEGAIRSACAADVKALCGGVSPGGGRIRQCMVEKSEQLSPGCKAAIGKAAAAKQAPAAPAGGAATAK